ncbi:MAG: hypothetical protein H7A50_06860 [Akkermansiaceae bacterium]|nr:hypothetical protein [Akkermansiaceae bacterium]
MSIRSSACGRRFRKFIGGLRRTAGHDLRGHRRDPAVVVAKAVQHGDSDPRGLGMQYLFAVVMLAGAIRSPSGYLKLGRFIGWCRTQ